MIQWGWDVNPVPPRSTVILPYLLTRICVGDIP